MIRTRVLGSPDIGTIYETVDLVGETEASPEFVACVQEQMYQYAGEAPPQAFDSTTTITHLGAPPSGQERSEWAARIFETVVTARLDEVRACEGDGGAQGSVTLTLSFAEDALADDATVDGPDTTDEVNACIADAARGWTFPRRFLADQRFSTTIQLPVDAAVGGMPLTP